MFTIIFIYLPVYIEDHVFTLISPIPIQQNKIYSNFLPFHIRYPPLMLRNVAPIGFLRFACLFILPVCNESAAIPSLIQVFSSAWAQTSSIRLPLCIAAQLYPHPTGLGSPHWTDICVMLSSSCTRWGLTHMLLLLFPPSVPFLPQAGKIYDDLNLVVNEQRKDSS